MSSNEVVAVVLAAGRPRSPRETERDGPRVGGLAPRTRVRQALAAAGVRDAFLISDREVEGDLWSGVTSRDGALEALARWSGGAQLLVLCGDLPLLTATTIRQFLDAAAASRASRFVESTGAMALFRTVDEAAKAIGSALRALEAAPDAPPCGDGTWHAQDPDDVRRLLSAADYPTIACLARRRTAAALAARGVLIVDPDRTTIDDTATVGAGTTVFPGTHIVGDSVIGADCAIGPDSWIEGSTIEDRVVVRYSVVEGARVRTGSTVGPFTHLRPKSDVGPEARVGNFVEVKASRLGKGVKAGHLSYIGDSDVGENTNVGAGAITCNYDGEAKHRTVVGPDVFVGSNVSLVAPVTIGRGAFLAAGSTITDDVPPETLAIARGRQVTRERKEKRRGEET